MSIPTTVKNHLKKTKLAYETIQHRTVFTAYDLAQTLQHKLDEIAKTLLVKADNEYHLVILPAAKRLDLGKLKKLLGAKKVSIAKEGEMKSKFGVAPGAITPFGSLHGVKVVVDSSLAKAKSALFGAGSFTESLQVKVKDFIDKEKALVGSFGVSAGLKLQTKPAARPKRGAAKKKTARRQQVRKRS